MSCRWPVCPRKEKIQEQMEDMIELDQEKIKLMEEVKESLDGDARQEMDELISEVEGFKRVVEKALKEYKEENSPEPVDRLLEWIRETSERRREITESVDKLMEENWERPRGDPTPP